MTTLPPVLDPCCASRSFWFNKADPRALFTDNRQQVVPRMGRRESRWPIIISPDIVADVRDLPFPNDSFWHVVFDPPHIIRISDGGGNVIKEYGKLDANWRPMLQRGFAECFRVLRPCGTLIFKWSETDIPLAEILKLTPEAPLYGHRRKTAGTYWVAFIKGAQ